MPSSLVEDDRPYQDPPSSFEFEADNPKQIQLTKNRKFTTPSFERLTAQLSRKLQILTRLARNVRIYFRGPGLTTKAACDLKYPPKRFTCVRPGHKAQDLTRRIWIYSSVIRCLNYVVFAISSRASQGKTPWTDTDTSERNNYLMLLSNSRAAHKSRTR
jgi:hypothetical protein